jgi:flagellar biosynthesis GTPase FlhF
MMFKQIFGKTVEAAITSAKQMYGDNFTIFQTSGGDEKKQAGISIVTDKKDTTHYISHPKNRKPVYYDRSSLNHHQNQVKTDISHELQSLRKIAESQFTNSEQTRQPFQPNQKNGFREKTEFTQISNNGVKPKPLDVYGRQSVRNAVTVFPEQDETDVMSETAPGKTDRPNRTLLSRFDESKPKINIEGRSQTVFIEPEKKKAREIQALHNRFDNLEALLDSQLMSANLEYASHPVFQQLVQTGIHPGVVSEWFGRIIKKGIGPFNQPENFMSEISAIIKNALTSSDASEAKKFQVFTGPSGSGKTSLIMKLLMNGTTMNQRNTAVVSLLPSGEKQKNYYTILNPFCNSHNFDYFKIGMDDDVTPYTMKWENYDYVLIDTPSLAIEQHNTFRKYLKLRQFLAPLSPLEVHFTLNISMNRHYFRSSSAMNHPVKPDFIALTHLDEISEWGPVIPLFEKMGCNARYLSIGDSLNNSLKQFEPAWLVKKMLENTE